MIVAKAAVRRKKNSSLTLSYCSGVSVKVSIFKFILSLAMGKIGIQTARDKVKAYCAERKIKQSDFGAILDLSHSTFQRFMGAGGETTGKGNLAYKCDQQIFPS